MNGVRKEAMVVTMRATALLEAGYGGSVGKVFKTLHTVVSHLRLSENESTLFITH
jgi:hypothetical protein